MTVFRSILVISLLVNPGFVHADPHADLKSRVTKMWESEDFEGLETMAAECLKAPMNLIDQSPKLRIFYDAIRSSPLDSDEDAKTLTEKCDRWLAAKPASVTARVAYANFLIADAWRIRGSNWAHLVPKLAWAPFEERLVKAREHLVAQGVSIKADPTVAGLRIILCMAGQDTGMMKHFNEATTWWPEYFPVYDNVARALLPRWGGSPGQGARFAQKAFNSHPGSKGAALYALIANVHLDAEKLAFFEKSEFDIPLYVRGLDYLANEGREDFRPFNKHRAAFVAAWAGNPPAARRRIYEIGPNVIPSSYLSYREVVPAWKQCGAMEELSKGTSWEKQGKLEEAETFYRGLTKAEANPWLDSFALRNGIARLWKPEYGTPSPEAPVSSSTPNQLFELTIFHLCAGNLEAAKKYAEAFDAQRGHNITGKYALAAVAALTGDRAGVEAIKSAFLSMNSDRKSYQVAQEYVAGRVNWEDTRNGIPMDEYFTQACSMMGAIALGEGRTAEAREIFEEVHRIRGFQISATFPESLLWGPLHRQYPKAMP